MSGWLVVTARRGAEWPCRVVFGCRLFGSTVIVTDVWLEWSCSPMDTDRVGCEAVPADHSVVVRVGPSSNRQVEHTLCDRERMVWRCVIGKGM